jgi:putative ABC transport system permease protein
MDSFRFIKRSIFYYRRQHLSLFLGIAVSAAVLTGALIIGDSIQFSLEKLVENRLGKTKIAVIGGSRFMDTSLALKLENSIHIPVSPVLMLRGIAINPESDARINQAAIFGIDQSFGNISESPLPALAEDEAIINMNIANRLKLKTGDELVIRVQSAGTIPVNAPFSREPAPTVAIRLKIKAVVREDQAGIFNLSNNQSGVFNVFVSLGFLGNKMDLKGLANALLIAGDYQSIAASAVEDSMQRVWSMKDLGMSVKARKGTGTYDLLSDRIFIDSIIPYVASKAHLPFEEIITYLVNDIGHDNRHTPYSFASAVSPAL